MNMRTGLVTTFLVAAAAAMHLSPASAAQTIEYTAQDLKVDTAIAVYFAEGNGRSQPYYFSLNGALTQMVMCKATFDSQKSRILTALRSHPDFKGRTPVAAACARTNQTPLRPSAR
ncbi:hypothetical protein VW29_19785 [Devosia limi DSM 17137]|uniref:UrcA family protein n=1 Tax=Devosia limi DSM 17137 TaxID=1121477 RepID=A0A0F5L1S5_9HYPH|nr:hypothetical protein [Devosia limi]KKB76323.1 hypothetical protein VW29_19785 [Devosia limi DSM 17137]SHF73258.1 hypothetical protein SAMN02745223_03429 [Devosia limi DSM 17137]